MLTLLPDLLEMGQLSGDVRTWLVDWFSNQLQMASAALVEAPTSGMERRRPSPCPEPTPDSAKKKRRPSPCPGRPPDSTKKKRRLSSPAPASAQDLTRALALAQDPELDPLLSPHGPLSAGFPQVFDFFESPSFHWDWSGEYVPPTFTPPARKPWEMEPEPLLLPTTRNEQEQEELRSIQEGKPELSELEKMNQMLMLLYLQQSDDEKKLEELEAELEELEEKLSKLSK